MVPQQILVAWLVKAWRQFRANNGLPLSALREKITWRKVVFVVALLIAAYALAQLVSLDMALFWAGDIAFYCEIASAVMFVIVKGHVRHSAYTAKRALTHATRRARIWCRRSMSARRRRTLKHHDTGHKGADDDGGWLPELGGFAIPP